MTGRVIPIQRAEDALRRNAAVADRHLLPGAIRLPALPPLSLYVHFPWCVRKCPYCDFNSHEAPAGGLPEALYLQALRRDLESALPLVWGRRVESVFIGGGTPSLLSAAGLDRLLSDLRALLPLAADAEITMEANPGSFEAEKFRAFRASGVNRLSIGVQSFSDAQLLALGRIHSGADAMRAIEAAAREFDNFNLDLMYALPQQSVAGLAADLSRALDFAPTHLSIYQLAIEANTVFAKYPPTLPDEDTVDAMLDLIEARTVAAGFDRYEVSAYARGGARSRHNLNYWTFGDYLGIGPGAHGKISFAERIVRQARVRGPDAYLRAVFDGSAVVEEREVGVDELGFEFMLNALRLRAGVPAALFEERTGCALSSIAAPLEQARARGLLEPEPTELRTTALGWRFLNEVQAMFLNT
jgi:putative oxygen-independent coproporphyrinogen III oxidase